MTKSFYFNFNYYKKIIKKNARIKRKISRNVLDPNIVQQHLNTDLNSYVKVF